ncbi:synaptotagmin-like protein 2 isoform X2 [Tachysurus fulvidraco]|uniref:synaptotagmin-like protein 2 isoform X2 n=1 Tax=Tachysurus fulvidraco TaxID=1234273 RepID=UPI001FEDBEF1|nr:synaptotagmin-like protein 2 isoform X2 [Tachysurus fulvidraco]
MDLSYLTEEEQEMILSVLKRDAELKHKEEQRIKKLQKTERDKQKLKYLTGEWFYETKSNRHRDKTHGSDIIRASMSRRKPVTIKELTQIWPRTSSFLKSESKDIFIPPELSGIIGEPSTSAHDNRDDHYEVAEYKTSTHPQAKPRPNPFNTRPVGSQSHVKTEGHFQTGVCQIPGNMQKVPANQQSTEGSLSVWAEPKCTSQIPAEDHHEDLAEPHSSQVSDPSAFRTHRGKVSQLSKEGRSQLLREEDESSINKVLGWVGMVSRHSGKKNKWPGFQEENREGPEGHVTPNTEKTSCIQSEIKAKLSTMLRMGLPGCPLDDKQDNINLRCSARNSGLNITTEEFEENSFLSMMERERERIYQGEVSQNRLSRLVSFWESGSNGPDVLDSKKIETNDDKVAGQKISKVVLNVSPSKAKKSKYTNICDSSFDTGQLPAKPIGDIPVYKLKEIYSPLLSVRTSEQNTISDPKTCWEREKSIPKIAISTPDCRPKCYSQQGFKISTSPNLVEIPQRSISSINRELGERKASSKGKLNQSSKGDLVNSPLDDTDTTPYNRSPFRTRMLGSGKSIKCNPVSPYPIRNLTSVSKDHSDQSTGDPMTILEQSRILSTRHMTKVLSGDLQSVKEYRQGGFPLRAFPLDINPTEKTPLKGLKDIPRGQHTRYPHELSSTEESSPAKDGILLAETPEQHLLSFAGNTSERIIEYQRTSPHSSPRFGRSEAQGTVCIGNINSKQVSFLPVSQGQTSVQLITSPAIHQKTTNKRSIKGIEDAIPVVLTQQMQLDDLQRKTSLTRSSVQLSCQHHSNVADSTHVSEVSHQPDQQEWAGAQMCKRSEHISYSLQSQAQSEVTLSSSTSTEACGSEAPSPVRTAQKQTIRPLSISKSLEDLATLPSNERWKNEQRSGIIQTVEEAPDSLSIAVLDPEQSKRLSVSVPAFTHEQVSGSVTNIYSTDFGHVEVKGTIQFAINYVNKLGELHIFIVQCRDLAAAEPKRNRSDPYVKCYLLPDKAKLGKRKTSVKKKTLNPTYNEILRYKIPLESLKVHTLNISVWHNDMFGRNSFLGEVNADLSEWDNNTHMMDRTLIGRTATPFSPKHVNLNMDVCGDMRISLRFLLQTSEGDETPRTGEIQVWVKECTKLQSIRRSMDPFVKCSILPVSHEKKRQKTRVVKRTTNPVFNHTMVYEGLRPEDLRETCVELTVWDHDRLSNRFIGGTRLNLGTGKSHSTDVKWMDSNASESALWRRMIESTNEWVEETIPLRMLIMAR